MDLKQLGVQSWCFRHFKDLDSLIGQVKGLGLSRVELCEVHVDFGDEAGFEKVVGKFRDSGVQITSIGVQTFAANEAKEEKWFRFCKLAGAKMISTNVDVASMPGGLQTAAKLAEKHDVRLGIHNHGGYHWLGNSQMIGNIMKHMGEHVGLCLDTAWCLQSGEDPLKWAEQYSGRLYGVHVKDFVFDRAGMWTDVVVGTGNLKLKEILSLASKAPHMMALTLEYEGDAENPGPKLNECVKAIAAMN